MQLVEAVILLFAGLVPGVWATLVDVYTVGASVFSTRIAPLLLVVVLLATNARYRHQATWGSAWLSLGCVESYYLSSSYTFAGMSRSTVVPLALLSVGAAGVAWVSWTAKHERGAFGLALKVLVLVATLVACVATHDGLSALDVVCALAMGYCLFFMRSRRVAIERHDPTLDAPAAEAAAKAATPTRRGASRDRRPRRTEPSSRESTPSRRKSRASAPSRRATSGRSDRRDARQAQASHPVTTLRLKRTAQPAETSTSHGLSRSGHATAPVATGSRAGHQAKAGATRSASRSGHPRTQRSAGEAVPSRQGSVRQGKVQPRSGSRSGSSARQQRPTKRTGGAVPDANRMRSSSADGRSRSNAKPHRRTGSNPRSHR